MRQLFRVYVPFARPPTHWTTRPATMLVDPTQNRFLRLDYKELAMSLLQWAQHMLERNWLR
jgi:hypothetical protein